MTNSNVPISTEVETKRRMFGLEENMMKRTWIPGLFLSAALLFLVTGCSSSSISLPDTGDDDGGGTTVQINEQELLDETFRIDIQEIEVVYNIYPDTNSIQGEATVRFTMREGQSVPVIHFDPAIRWATPTLLQLNGEDLDFNDSEDVRVFTPERTTQQSIEFQRELSGNDQHTLRVRFPMNATGTGTSFFTDVNDIYGNGNEERFPTINTPHELARHRIRFRVHSETPYRCFGSGSVVKSDNQVVQEWELDTGREVASYTVMFMVMPAADTVYAEQTVDGVDVRVMAYACGTSPQVVFDDLESWLPELRQNLGPFPMPGGISIFLTESGGGMEYYGGTITSLRALDHEVFHMYFGCSTVALTYRDSWWDEAINMWYEYSAAGNYAAIDEGYQSNIVSRRSPVSVGFDTRAYDEGARIIQAVANEMGGRGEMIDFLSDLHQRRMFDPFNTFELVDEIEAYSGVDMYDRFLGWLYYGSRTYYAKSATDTTGEAYWLHKVDMTPPDAILRKYGLKK